jgi:hypothetical protein
MNFPRERFPIIIAAGLVIVLAACFLTDMRQPANLSQIITPEKIYNLLHGTNAV